MGAVTVSAAGGSIGSGGTMGVYTPSAGVITQQVMLAMPGSWTNQMTAQQGDVAGVYWWSGADNVSADFPGYKTTRVDEDGVYNLFSTQSPGYGNGESGDANLMVWNNYLDDLSIALNNLFMAYDLDIVISGSMAPYLEKRRNELDLRLFREYALFPIRKRLIFSHDGEYAAAIGSAAVVINTFLSDKVK